MLGVGTHRVVRDEELAGDLGPGQLTVEQPEHLQFAVAQRLEAVGELSPLALVEVADRIGAVGGGVAAEPLGSGSISVEAVIPCAS